MKTFKVENELPLPVIPFSELKKYKRNALKDNNNREVGDLKNSIISDGFKFPIYVWEKGKYIIDGAGRTIALELLEYEGYTIPDIPYFPIKAKNLNEAKKNTLQVSSSYGRITADSIGSFLFGMEEIDTSFINIDGWDMEEIDWKPPVTKEIDIEELKGKTKMEHTCPKCDFSWSSE